MSSYDNRMLSSDLDAYRSDGNIQTRSVTFSGNVGVGSTQTQTTASFSLTDQDFYQVLFDNSIYSSGKWRELAKEDLTFVLDTTSGAEIGVYMQPKITGNSMTIVCSLVNFSGATLTLQSTTINFRFVSYDSTLL